MRSATVLLALLLAAAISAAEIAPPEALIDRHAETFNRGDAAALAALYADDGRVFSADGRPVRGRGDIEKFWRAELLKQRRRLQLASSEMQTSADIAYAIGVYTLTAPRQTGTFTMCFKRGPDGAWKIMSSMWNANAAFGYTPLIPR